MTAILVAGTTSEAGTSVITAGICRWLARQGLTVAPFQAQNMSLSSYSLSDAIGEHPATTALPRLTDGGPRTGLPLIPQGAP